MFCKLAFKPRVLFCIGSPVAMFLTLRSDLSTSMHWIADHTYAGAPRSTPRISRTADHCCRRTCVCTTSSTRSILWCGVVKLRVMHWLIACRHIDWSRCWMPHCARKANARFISLLHHHHSTTGPVTFQMPRTSFTQSLVNSFFRKMTSTKVLVCLFDIIHFTLASAYSRTGTAEPG